MSALLAPLSVTLALLTAKLVRSALLAPDASSRRLSAAPLKLTLLAPDRLKSAAPAWASPVVWLAPERSMFSPDPDLKLLMFPWLAPDSESLFSAGIVISALMCVLL